MTDRIPADEQRTIDAVDWAPFDRWAESICTCRCGWSYRSHAKVCTAPSGDGFIPVTRKPCPGCRSQTSCTRIAGEPETMEF